MELVLEVVWLINFRIPFFCVLRLSTFFHKLSGSSLLFAFLFSGLPSGVFCDPLVIPFGAVFLLVEQNILFVPPCGGGMHVCVVCRNVASLGVPDTVSSVFSMISKYFVMLGIICIFGMKSGLHIC